MKLILFSIDQNIWQNGSAVQNRVKHYGSLVEYLDVIVFGQGKSENLANNVRLHSVNGNKAAMTFKAIMLCKKLANKDTVISSQDPFELGLIGYFASKLARVPLHVQVHIDFYSKHFKNESIRQKLQSWIASFVIKRAKSVRVVSQKIGTYLKDHLNIPAKQITIAPVFIDITAAKIAPVTVDLHKHFPQFSTIVLVAARHVKQKNIYLAIEAFEIFKQKAGADSKVGLVIAGSGPLTKEISQFLNDNNLGAAIKIGTWSKEFASCMKTSDIFLLSSDYEGWGMTVIEAAALGKPLVMTNVGCANEFIFEGKNGLIVPTRDREKMAEALFRIYSDKTFAKSLSENAEKDASSYMSLNENDKLIKSSWEMALGNFV